MDLTPERGVEHQVGWLCVPWRNGYGGWAFRGRSATSDTSGSECLEKGRGSYVGPLEQNIFLKAERESPESVSYTSMPVWSGDSGVDRTTTAAGFVE